ncbi:hypothetical protein CCR94_15205 [Rhodoblastus sphagnicola]|uniref:Phosphate-starvation-inducible E-like protein n=1 Tax=Rhodoblastus sphagnicola TaxID=333368 RepID=A0A2S6N498_9HYPH|nr:phosphate-starvation-inducible PsiE family protein [Rhodoblastus sphagnicola]MBB4200352.1 uncharacterized membrane protein (DUF373 family) [Rhodoblastus sphagnicola]PPQ29453.1 hypothetical protein CCR94_15205 [Rhodoblastus sphagnicola]
MESVKSDQQDAETNWIAGVSQRAFMRIEVSAYLVLGLLLSIVALMGIVGAVSTLAKTVLEVGSPIWLVVTIDRILLVLMIIEILHTVRVSFNEGALVCEPFLVVGLIASIRRVLVITLESSQVQDTGKSTAELHDLFNSTMIELCVLAGLIFVMVWSIYLLRRAKRPGGSAETRIH